MQGKKKIRVLVILDNFNLGGAERQAIILTDLLNGTNDFQVSIASLNPEGNLLEDNQVSKLLIKLKQYKSHTNLALIICEMFFYSIRLRKLKPDVIIPFTIRPNVIVNFAWQLTGAKCCFWNQRDEGFGFPKTRDVMFYWSFWNSTAYIANSVSSGNALTGYLRGIASKVTIIPNGISPTYPSLPTKEWQSRFATEGRLVAVMIANLTNRKDHETVIKSWAYLKYEQELKTLPKLILVGKKAESFEKLNDLINQLRLTDDIVFSDFVVDIAGLLTIADIAIHSSLSEGMPNAILECMQKSKPVIASDILAHRNVLGEDYKFLFGIGDYKQLSEMVISLCNSRSERESLGARNQKRLEENFAALKMMNAYSDLIKSKLK